MRAWIDTMAAHSFQSIRWLPLQYPRETSMLRFVSGMRYCRSRRRRAASRGRGFPSRSQIKTPRNRTSSRFRMTFAQRGQGMRFFLMSPPPLSEQCAASAPAHRIRCRFLPTPYPPAHRPAPAPPFDPERALHCWTRSASTGWIHKIHCCSSYRRCPGPPRWRSAPSTAPRPASQHRCGDTGSESTRVLPAPGRPRGAGRRAPHGWYSRPWRSGRWGSARTPPPRLARRWRPRLSRSDDRRPPTPADGTDVGCWRPVSRTVPDRPR